jgi:hypothetical protein
MKAKYLLFVSFFAALALTASFAMGRPLRTAPTQTAPTVTRTAPSGTTATFRHHRHFGGDQFIFFGGFGYPFYPYYNSYWGYPYGYYPYGYYYYNQPYYNQPAYGYGPYNGSLVLQVQRRLARAGYYRGAIDGMMGPRTRYAIRTYERDHGLRVDGVISGQLLATMGLRY